MITSLSYSYRGSIEHPSLIKAIRSNDLKSVKSIINSFPEAINEIDPDTGKNAAMLAAAGILPSYIEVILSHAEYLDFEHVDNFGNNLFVNAQMSQNNEILQFVRTAYEDHAAHILNNWPYPLNTL